LQSRRFDTWCKVADAAKILILGAGGLIGGFIAGDLLARGFPTVAVARKFSRAQRYALRDSARACSIGDFDGTRIAELLKESDADIVVNCLGMLQAMPGEVDIHETFVARLLEGMRLAERPVTLIHLSIPGFAADDRTGFSITKRGADTRIAQSGIPYVILRPGFVIAPAAYGGSALLRALAALPFVDLSPAESERPFAVVAVEDIAATVAWIAGEVQRGKRNFAETWDLMSPAFRKVGEVIGAMRRWLGAGERPRVSLPSWLFGLGAKAGDLVAFLGWRPPVRSTAIAEMRRGVVGDPGPWVAATGIVPKSLDAILQAHPSTVQERWFARLFLLKAVAIATLVVFWCASGLIALTVAFHAAAGILVAHRLDVGAANALTVLSSAIDIGVGLAIAMRRTHRAGLIAGVFVSLGYMLGAAVLTPDLWIEPLGALVKTGPAIVLMLMALAMADSR
jgi:uncharacterized protein YbjT (DUF2867 family)